MSLKNIKLDLPTYRATVPSSQKEVSITPFKVKDEKLLLIASESKNEQQLIDSMKKVIDNNVVGEDVNNLYSYDIEYLFLRIRAISIGETSNIQLKCKECETANDVVIDLTTVNVINLDSFNNKIKLTDTLMFQMDPPNLDKYVGVGNDIESLTRFLATNVSKVFHGDEIYDVGPTDIDDVINIMNELTAEQFQGIQTYVDTLPKLSHDVNFVCTHCGTDNSQNIQGLSNFLA
jgi:hypothetical protein